MNQTSGPSGDYLPYSGRDVPVKVCCPEGSEPHMLNNPSGITIHPLSSNLYVTDSKNHRVQIYDPDGGLITTFDASAVMVDPCGIRIFEDRMYVTQNPGHFITVFHEDGTLIQKFGRSGKNGPFEFRHPYDIDVDRTNGSIYVCDMDNNRIQIFTRDFEFITMFGPGLINRPHNLKLIDQELYILNQTTEGELIHIYEDSMCIDTIRTGTEYPICFDIDRDGNFLILQYYRTQAIKIFSKDGRFLQSIGKAAFPSMPRSMTIDQQGRILVVCGTNGHNQNCFYIF